MSYKDLLGPDGTENNMGGTKQFFYYAAFAAFASIAAPAPAPVDPDDKYVIATAHTFNTGEKFNKMYCTMDTSELEAAVQGETDGQSYKLSFKFNYPGSKKETIKFINESKNDKFIFLVPLPDGTIIQLGNEDWTASVKPAFKTNKNSGSRFTEFTVECMMPDILLYDAAISLTPAV